MGVTKRLSNALSFTWPVFDFIHAGIAWIIDERAVAKGSSDRFRYNREEHQYEIVHPGIEDDAERGYVEGAMAGVAGAIPVMYLGVLAVAAAIPGSPVWFGIGLLSWALGLGAVGHWFAVLDTRVYTEETEWMVDA